MPLSKLAKRLFEYLPEDGSTVGGITIRKDLDLSTPEYQAAKDELRDSGLVIFGRGRGGSVARVEGKELEKETTPEERMAIAREAKTAQSRERKETDRKRQIVLEFVQKTFPQVELKHISFYGSAGEVMVEVWEKGTARMYGADYNEIVEAS